MPKHSEKHVDAGELKEHIPIKEQVTSQISGLEDKQTTVDLKKKEIKSDNMDEQNDSGTAIKEGINKLEVNTNVKEGQVEYQKESLSQQLEQLEAIDTYDSPEPVISNKDMRRRTTFLNRGKRNSIMSGGSIGFPHHTIETKKFYQHISPQLPAIQRMKQLVVWCCKRAQDKQSQGRFIEAYEVANKIQNEIIKEIINGDMNVSWLQRKKQKKVKTLNPHPENIANLEKKKELKQEIQELEQQQNLWKKEIEVSNVWLKERKQRIENSSLQTTELQNSLPQEQLAALKRLATTQGIEPFIEMKKVSKNLEFKVHKLKDSLITYNQSNIMLSQSANQAIINNYTNSKVDAEYNLDLDPALLLKAMTNVNNQN